MEPFFFSLLCSSRSYFLLSRAAAGTGSRREDITRGHIGEVVSAAECSAAVLVLAVEAVGRVAVDHLEAAARAADGDGRTKYR